MGDRSRSDGMAFCLPPPSTGPRDSMRHKVTFTPDRYLRKIWQLGNYDVSPDGRLLAYSANKGEQWSVYVMDLRTKREKPLLESDQSIVQPEFSRDGRWLAVQSDFEGDENYNIYVTPAAGGSARKVTDTRWDSASPRWSPNGKRIAFLSNRDGDRDNVFVVDTQGGEAKQLTNVDDIVTEIAWRPDGKSIAFSAGVGLHDYVGLVDLNGRLEKVVDFPESESSIGGDAGPPAPWSADGANLAFVSNVHDHLDIGVLDLRRRRVRWLVQSKWDKSRPLWSPDGKRIAFLENRDGNIQLKTISAAGRGARAISSPKGTASHAVWHPKGQGLFYLHSTFTRRDRLRPGVEAPQRPRPRRGGHGRHHRRRSVAREERLLRPGPTRGDRHVLRRIRGRPHPGESSRPLGGWGQCRRLLQLDDRDVERARLSAAVRPPEDGASGHGRGPVPQVFADLFLGQHPGPRPVHRRRARSPVPRHGGAGDGRGDAEDGENRRLPRVPGRRPFAPQGVESDPAPRARDRVAHAVPAGRVTPHREARIAFRSQSMVSRSAWVPIVPMRIVLPRSGPRPPEM